MEVERNLLRKVIERLDKEYESIGWQIEYIDLRWGISPDAGEDNRTMTICLNELAQCQKLSPRPNFIMLIGERYGWRPLPETISIADMRRVYEAAMPEEVELLDRWYVRDDNDLTMQGAYVLKSRLGSGYDGERFHREVELPLLILFYRELPFTDCSATEMEIRKGALDAAHASDHVFAYMRSLKDVPDDKRVAYYDSDASGLEYIARLKRKVSELAKPENVYEENVAWEEYLSDGFASRFSQTIEEHLRKIVEKEVSRESVDDIDYELFEHREYAASEAVGFYGRADDIKKIREYVDSTEPDMPLWIKGDSGLGKSALMAKVVSLYTADKSYCVMPFFSSLTPRSSGAQSMLELVRNCFDREYADRYRKDKRKPYEKFVNLVDEAHRFSHDKRYLIIIDAFNQLDNTGYDDFDSLIWAADKEKLLPSNVKIIITSTTEGRFPKEHPRLRVMHLEAIKSDALRVVVSRLQAAGRRLQSFQLAQLKVLLGDKEQSALYLSLLSSVLQHYDSTMDLTGLPGDYVSMCSMILDRLASPQMHGRRLTRLALAMIVMSSDGVDVNSLNGLLASDYELQAELMERSFHLWIQEDVKSVPPIIWSRLFYDLDRVILVSRSTSIGVAVKVRHDAIHEFIKYRWLTEDERKHASELQVRWYEENLFKENKLAIRDFVHAVHAPVDDIHSLDDAFDSALDGTLYGEEEMSIRKAVGRKLWGILSDERYILLKEKYFPDTIVSEYDRLLSIYTELGDIRRRELVSQMKNFVSYTSLDDKAFRESWSVGQNMPPLSPLELQARVINLWDGHPLREIPPERLYSKLMRDKLNNIDSERYTLFSIDNCGRYPWLNPSGEKLYRIVTGADGHPILERLDLVSGTIETIFIFIEPFTYAISADEKILAMHYSEGIQVFKLVGMIPILSIFKKGITWMSLSDNGQYIAYGGPTIKTDRVEIATSRSYTWISADEGMLSPSGNRLWIYYIKEVPEREKEKWDSIVGCCDFVSLKSDTVAFKYDKKPRLTSWSSSRNKIIGCSEHIAVIDGDQGKIFNFQDNRLRYWKHYRQAPINSVKFINGTSDFYLFYLCSGAYQIARVADTMLSVIEQGNMHVVDQVTPDFTRALSISNKKVFDFRQLRKSFAVNNHGNYSGINSFSASYSGDVMVVSIGRNVAWETGEIRVPVLTVKNSAGEYDEMFLDVDRSEYCHYVSASAVSPDGKYLAYCTYTNQESIIFVYDVKFNKLLSKYKICAQASSILFTSDSFWFVVITSDWLFRSDMSLYLFDCTGNFVKELLIEKDCHLDEYKVAALSPDNRFVSVGISGPMIDLSSCKVVSQGKKMDGKFSLKAIRKYEDRRYDNYDVRGLFHPVNSTVVDRYLENGELCISISASGRYMFTIDTGATMSVVDSRTGQVLFSLKNVESVLPVADDRHLYVSCYDNTISLYDVDGTRLQFTSLHNAKAKRYWQSTAQGLAVAKHDCHCALFATDPANKVNELPVTVLRRRWNLTTGKLRDPEAVCPMCGHVIDKGFSVDEMHCPGCGHRLRLIVNTDKNYPVKILNGILKIPALARKIIK